MSSCSTPSILQALAEAGLGFDEIDAVAATAGPGLVGGLIVGVTMGKAIALGLGVPFIAVNHLEAHALTAGLTDGLGFPYLLLLVSGGHTQTVIVKDVGAYERLGTTLDDALGEAFDKAAKLLGLAYPGGPEIERHAARGRATVKLPRPDARTARAAFLARRPQDRAQARGARAGAARATQDIADLAASFQEAVADIVSDRTGCAIEFYTERLGAGARARWSWRAESRPTRGSRLRSKTWQQARFPARRAAACALHRQCGDDRLGRGHAACARPDR